jgi:hypothetical protein
MRDISTKFTGDAYSADEFNSTQVELENVVTSAGLTLDPAAGPDVNQNQLGQTSAAYSCAGNFFDAGGTTDAIVLSSSSGLKPPAKYLDKMRVTFRATGDNTGAVTVNVGGIGLKKVLDPKDGTSDLSAGMIKEDAYITLLYDTSLEGGSGAFVLVNYPTSTIRFTYEEVENDGGGYGDLLQRTGSGTSVANAWVGRRISNIYGATWLSPGGLTKVDPGDTYNTIFSLAAGTYDFNLTVAARDIGFAAVRIVDYPFSETFYRKTLVDFSESAGRYIHLYSYANGTVELDATKSLQIQMVGTKIRSNVEAFGWSMTTSGKLTPAADFGPNVYCDLQLVRRNYY